MTSNRMKIAIVGGGAFGLAAATEAARRGHRVELFERGPLPHPQASSTDLSKAVRMDYGDDLFYVELAARALDAWRRLDARWGGDVFHEVGILLLARRSLDDGGFERSSHDTLRGAGVPVERLDAAGLASRFPAWAGSPYVDGYVNPQAGWVAASRAVTELAHEARDAGAAIHASCGPVRPDRVEGRTVGVALEDRRAAADVVLVAAGAWTPWFVEEAAALLRPTGQPVRHLAPLDPAPFHGERFPVWCADIARSGWYGFPATADGVVKLGNHGPGVAVDVDTPLEVDETSRVRFDAFVDTELPALRGAPAIAHRLCLYCDAIDGDLLVDRVPGDEGLAVAAGGSGHGFKFAPVLGPIIVDALEGREHPASARFGWRQPSGPRAEAARHRG